MKRGMPGSLDGPLDYITVLFRPYVALGVALLIVWMLSRMALLSWADLSYVVPVTAIGYVLVAIVVSVGSDVRAQRPLPKDPFTDEMRQALSRIDKVHEGMDQTEIDNAVEALHREIGRHDPKVFVPEAIRHLMRLAPRARARPRRLRPRAPPSCLRRWRNWRNIFRNSRLSRSSDAVAWARFTRLASPRSIAGSR